MLFRDLEQKIVKVINDSGMSIDGVYFIMKSLMQEIEQKYFKQCEIEDMEAAQHALELTKENEELNSKKEKSISAE